MVLFVTVVCVILFLVCLDIMKPRGFPPGPMWLPVLGNLLWFRQQKTVLGYYHFVWSSLYTQYGPVVGLRLGRDRIVIVSGYDAVRDVLLREEFDGRPDGFFFRLRTFGKRLGVVFTDGPGWLEQRRFCLRHLRKFGLGKRSMEAQIETEAGELVQSLRIQCRGGEAPLQLHDVFDVCVLNTLWAMLAGHRFALDDQRLKELLEIVHASFRMLDVSGGLLNQMPLMRFIAPNSCGYKQILGVLQPMWGFLKETIEEHRSTFSRDCARDLIDSFIEEMESRNGKAGLMFNDLQLVSLCLDLFMAGSETTSNTLGFAVMYMLLHPDVQSRAQAELDSVVGRDRQPTLQDRPRLCFLESVIMEVQRRANIAPAALPHRALKDAVLMGHTIPEGATLLVSLWSLHMDSEHWGDPEVFRPQRFLDDKGCVVQDDWFVPFGFGKRRCLGEMLARSSLFLFFSSLLHNFSISLPPGYPAPSVDGYDGVTLSPRPFYAKLVPRT
ncbi:methyl farnesoate epoxidase-like isoform X2 [Periplaneta americana]|uniref:methyl farnesoate epoxidase-like isoform X2 n=1 Tax=Periplaneta americana TaxID=6978 RepID=UPI0037E84413